MHCVCCCTPLQIEGEKLALAANGKGGLVTVALRPSGIFGEGDPVFVPSVVKQVRSLRAFTWLGSLLS